LTLAGSASDTLAPSNLVRAFPTALLFPKSAPLIASANIHSFSVENFGQAAVSFQTPSISSSEFSVLSNGCTQPLMPRSSCRVTVQTYPRTEGPYAATLSLSHSASGAPILISLVGNANVAAAEFIPSVRQLAFGEVEVGFSTSRSIELKNTSNQSIQILSVSTASSVFSIAENTCSGLILAKTSCRIKFVFSPSLVGTVSTNVLITHTGASAQTAVPLTGIGAPSSISATVVPNAFDFGVVERREIWEYRYAVLKNTGTKPISLDSFFLRLSNQFQIEHSCASVLEPGKSCLLTVKLYLTDIGEFSNDLDVTASGLRFSLPVKASVVLPLTLMRLNPASIAFGSTEQGQAITKTIAVENLGTKPLWLNEFIVTSGFGQDINACTAVVSPGASCNVTLNLLGASPGVQLGTWTLKANTLLGTYRTKLSGYVTETECP
jgi:Abnormal spindle-like microcephaly-assoc'd, ASPM-SPD-2-Hydin